MTDLTARLQSAVGTSYRIEKELGGGGMSRVFLAEEVRLGRKVVIKVLPPEMGAGVNVERFEREIQLAAKLQHPHIVPLLTAGSEGDLLYYMMPFIEGESLRAKLAREGELPVGETVRIMKEVVDALAYAHERDVVHRDIKPDNVLLSGKHAVVTDFGVAKAVSASTGKSSLTSLGVALGTPAYMAPEQAVADPHVDHRADIYAVGAMAYEMLTGRPPFTGPNPQAVLSAQVTEAPTPATRHRATVPESLNAVIMRCLEKKAADRWQKAEELIPQLDAILTPTGGITPTGTQPVAAVSVSDAARAFARAHPGRVAAGFLASSVIVLFIVYAIVRLVGLPDWVFSGAIALLLIGLPIMLLTGHHERQRAIAQTTGLRVATPVGLRQLFTWRKALLGGGLAFAGLGAVAAAYMAMRLLGIGPLGTLVAAGVLDDRGRIIVADFEDRTADANFGTSVTEAFRIDLAQSPLVRLLDAAAIAGALRRMNRAAGATLDASLAKEIAEREGVKAIVVGDIGELGRGYVLSARLLSPTDGAELVALRETADDDGGIIAAVDRLSAKLRERIGESLKTIRGGAPLERVTTASLAALRTYSRGIQAFDQGDLERASDLLQEAIGLDSTFAMAHRKLAVVRSNSGAPQSQINAAAAKAFTHRERLPDVERYLAEAYYYDNVEFDRPAVVRAYRSVLEMDPDQPTALNNLSIQLYALRQYEEAERLALHAIDVSDVAPPYVNGAVAQWAQGKYDEARGTIDRFAADLPDHPSARSWAGMLAAAEHDYARADSLFGSVLARQRASPVRRGFLSGLLGNAAEVRGRLADTKRQRRESMAAAVERDDRGAYLRSAVSLGWLAVLYRGAPADGVREVEAALQRYPLADLEPTDRPYAELARVYVSVGRVPAAKRLLAEYEAAVPEPQRRADFTRHRAAAAIAEAEGRYEDAIAGYRAWYQESGCTICGLAELARVYERAGQPDSALAIYQRAVNTPAGDRLFDEYQTLAQTYKRLGELHQERGERDQALDYYGRFADLWKDADPELQPVVREVRERIARLAGER